MDHPRGWTCELIVTRLELYLLGKLPRGEALAVGEHVEACDGCAHRLVLSRLAVPGSAEARGGRG